MLLAAGVAVAGVAVYKHEKKKWRRSNLYNDHGGQTVLMTHGQNVLESHQLQHSNQTDDPNVLVQKRIILANLVSGMYERVRNPDSDFKQYWENHDYELVPLLNILKPEDLHLRRCREYIEKEENKHKYFGVFHKRNTVGNPAAPEWVVAIRGTWLKHPHDWLNDVKICLEKLHTSSTVKLLKIVISRLVEDMGYPKGSKLAVTERGTLQRPIHNLRASLAVTGHSLGASTAMLVARKFALRGFLLDSHFFNPPFATLTAIARFWIRKFLSPFFGKTLRDNYRKIRTGVSTGLNLCLDNGMRMRKQRAEYQALANWSPYLYLNKNDPVCGMYISHFFRRRLRKARFHQTIDSWYSVGSALLRVTYGDARTFHLMPRAICCIARTEAHDPLSAHKLEIWTQPEVPIEVKSANLELEVNEEHSQLTLKVGGDDSEGEEDVGEEEDEVPREEWIKEEDWFKEEADHDDHQNWSPPVPTEQGREQYYGWEYPRESIESEWTPERVEAERGRQSWYPPESILSEPTAEQVHATWVSGCQSYGWEYPRESIEPVQAVWGQQSYGWEYPAGTR